MFTKVLTLTVMVAQVVTQAPAWTTDDESVYSAIMKAGELRVKVDRVAASGALPIPAEEPHGPAGWPSRSLRMGMR